MIHVFPSPSATYVDLSGAAHIPQMFPPSGCVCVHLPAAPVPSPRAGSLDLFHARYFSFS